MNQFKTSIVILFETFVIAHLKVILVNVPGHEVVLILSHLNFRNEELFIMWSFNLSDEMKKSIGIHDLHVMSSSNQELAIETCFMLFIKLFHALAHEKELNDIVWMKVLQLIIKRFKQINLLFFSNERHFLLWDPIHDYIVIFTYRHHYNCIIPLCHHWANILTFQPSKVISWCHWLASGGWWVVKVVLKFITIP